MATVLSKSLTAWLSAWGTDDAQAQETLVLRVYRELRRIAGAHLKRERPGHTLQPTALVHEAYLRLRAQDPTVWRDRVHFFAIASRMMRRILVDHARHVRYAKRGGGRIRVTLPDLADHQTPKPHLVLEIDRLLDRLAHRDETKAEIVELRFFGGLTESEVAEVLGCSTRTVTRHWRTARAWLLECLDESASTDG
jgi:RNA polymerase sigma factor (TIGR02999 family)